MSQRMIYQTEETRHHILQVAVNVFLERGFFDTQMKDLAEAAGMSRNTLYRYYRDKTDLGLAILEMVIEKLLVEFGKAIKRARKSRYFNHRDMLGAVLREIILTHCHDTEWRYIAEFDSYHSGKRLPDNFVDRQDRSAWEPIAGELSTIIQEGIDEGSIRDDFSPQLLLQVILMAAKATQQEVLNRRSALNKYSDQMVPLLITLLIDGLKPNRP